MVEAIISCPSRWSGEKPVWKGSEVAYADACPRFPVCPGGQADGYRCRPAFDVNDCCSKATAFTYFGEMMVIGLVMGAWMPALIRPVGSRM